MFQKNDLEVLNGEGKKDVGMRDCSWMMVREMSENVVLEMC